MNKNYVAVLTFNYKVKEDVQKLVVLKEKPKHRLDVLKQVDDLITLDLNNKEAKAQYERLIDNLLGSGHFVEGDLNHETIGELLVDYFFSNKVDDVIESYPDLLDEIGAILEKELKSEHELNFYDDNDQLVALKSFDVYDLGEQEMKTLEKMALI